MKESIVTDWVLHFSGQDASAAAATLGEWLDTEHGYQLAPVIVSHEETTRSAIGDIWRRIRPGLQDAAAVAGILALLVGSAPAPDTDLMAMRAELQKLVSKVEQLQCEKDFILDLVDTQSGTSVRLGTDELNRLVRLLCRLEQLP